MNSARSMKITPASPKPPTADEVAELADRGEDVSRYFTKAGKMMTPFAADANKEGDGKED
jgi:hypothetical protein